MITVSVLINGEPIYARSAVRIAGEAGEVCTYACDDGTELTHNYNDGAVKLAHKLLDTIKETSPRQRRCEMPVNEHCERKLLNE